MGIISEKLMNEKGLIYKCWWESFDAASRFQNTRPLISIWIATIVFCLALKNEKAIWK